MDGRVRRVDELTDKETEMSQLSSCALSSRQAAQPLIDNVLSPCRL